MNRKQTEKRILYIVNIMKNQTLIHSLKEVLPLFSESELDRILKFLESGKEEVIYDLLKEKIDEYRGILTKIHILKSKVKIEKMEATDTEDSISSLERLNLI